MTVVKKRITKISVNETWILRQGERELFRFVAVGEVRLRHAKQHKMVTTLHCESSDDPYLLTAEDATGPLFTVRLASTRGLRIERE
jgi:hypothetical protein